MALLRERFWNELNKVVDRVGNGYRLCLMGDLLKVDKAFELPDEK